MTRGMSPPGDGPGGSKPQCPSPRLDCSPSPRPPVVAPSSGRDSEKATLLEGYLTPKNKTNLFSPHFFSSTHAAVHGQRSGEFATSPSSADFAMHSRPPSPHIPTPSLATRGKVSELGPSYLAPYPSTENTSRESSMLRWVTHRTRRRAPSQMYSRNCYPSWKETLLRPRVSSTPRGGGRTPLQETKSHPRSSEILGRPC